MRKSIQRTIEGYSVTINQMLFDQFLVASGHLMNLASGALKELEAQIVVCDGDFGNFDLSSFLEVLFSRVKPGDLPKICRDLMVDTVIAGVDPMSLTGGMVNNLDSHSRQILFGENPDIAFQIIIEVIKLNAGFTKKLGKLWTSLTDGLPKTSENSSEPSTV